MVVVVGRGMQVAAGVGGSAGAEQTPQWNLQFRETTRIQLYVRCFSSL